MGAVPSERLAERRERLRAIVREEADDVTLLVTHLPNVRYLSGFSGSNAVLVIGREPGGDLLGTDGRYVDQAAAEAPGLPTVIDRDTLPAVLAAAGPGPFAVEDALSVGEAATVRTAAGEPVVVSGLAERLRAVKDPDEIAALARACAITAEAFEALAGEMRVGATEVLLARRLEQLFAELGAEDRAFDTIVGSGPHSAIPHHQPGPRALQPGDLVVVDAGARVDGYHADMTRTFLVAAEPMPWQAEVHGVVASAQAAATQAYRPGADRRGIDAVARERIERAWLGDRFTHGLGHGVGLEIHEAPMIGARSTGTISADMVITVEPGVYLPGRGGVRIEDTLVVTDAGPRILTEAPRELRVVG
jgi:Xaa-Pro aminopeptidase